MKYHSSKVLSLIPLTEQSRSANLHHLVSKAKASQLGIVSKDWRNHRWDVTAKFAVKTRPGKGRKNFSLLFTRDPKSSGKGEDPFREPFGDLIKALVVLRYEARPRTQGSLQQFIDAFRHVYEALPDDVTEVRLLRSAHFENACVAVKARYARSTTQKMIGRIEEIADLLDANNLVSCRLDYRFRVNHSVSESEDVSKQRLDMPETLGKAEDKRVALEVLGAIGQLYKAIPQNNVADALLVRLVMLMAVLGRRIGEILSLPLQTLKYDQNNRPYLIYFPQKKSVGVLQTFTERLWVIPQTSKLIESLLADIQLLTAEARSIATQVEATGAPDLRGLPRNEWITSSELATWLGIRRTSATQWARGRNIPYQSCKRKCLYRRTDIDITLKQEAITGPVLTTSSTPRHLFVSDLLFIAQPSTFHRKKAPKPYAAAVVTEGQVRDFLKIRGKVKCAFERYHVLENIAGYRSNPHSFRHFLNDLLDRAGMPLLAQTAWFGRLDPKQTTVYHGTTSAEIVLKAQQYAANIDNDKATASTVTQSPVTFNQMKQLAQQRPVHDLGDGACIHHRRQAPCPHSLKAPALSGEFYWISNKADASGESRRQIHMNEGLLDLALARAPKDPFATAWVEHYKSRLDQLRANNNA